MAMRLAVSYIPCATYSKEQTGDILTFAQFEEGNLLSENSEYAEINDKSGDKSDENSIIPPLLNEEEVYVLDSGD